MAAKRRGIFEKRRLSPAQLRAIVQRRFDDAMCLLRSGNNARATGAMYISGFVIECLLKAILLDRHPNLARHVDPAKLSRRDREIFNLLYSHDLDLMLDSLPEVQAKLFEATDAAGNPIWPGLVAICEQ